MLRTIDVEPIIGSYEPDAIYLGRLFGEDGPTEKLMYGGDQHVVLVGTNGKGKSASFLFPNLLRVENRSLVVVDVKGELAAVSAPFRSTVGRVKIINPFGVFADRPGYGFMKSTGFNPLAHLDPDSPSFNEKASRVAEALIPVDPNTRDPHWPRSARSMVAAIVMYVVIEAKKGGWLPSMRRVRNLLCEASEEPSRAHPQGLGLPKLAADMIKIALHDAWSIKQYQGLKNKASQFFDYTREVASIASTARIQTESFDDPRIADDMEYPPFDFSSIKEEPTTVYIVLPPEQLERHSKWLRLMLTIAFDGVMRPREVDEPKTLFILDEFFALGRLDIIETVWALVRGYGIQLLPVLQDMEQFSKLYPDRWKSLIGSAGAVLCFAATDDFTQDWLAKQAGETTRVMTASTHATSIQKGTGLSVGRSAGGGSSPAGGSSSYQDSTGSNQNESRSSTDTISSTKTKAPVITPQTIRGLPAGFMLGIFDGVKNIQPIYAAPYMDIKMIWDRAYANPYAPKKPSGATLNGRRRYADGGNVILGE